MEMKKSEEKQRCRNLGIPKERIEEEKKVKRSIARRERRAWKLAYNTSFNFVVNTQGNSASTPNRPPPQEWGGVREESSEWSESEFEGEDEGEDEVTAFYERVESCIERWNETQQIELACNHHGPCKLQVQATLRELERLSNTTIVKTMLTGGKTWFERVIMSCLLEEHSIVIPMSAAGHESNEVDMSQGFATQTLSEEILRRELDDISDSWFAGDSFRFAWTKHFTPNQALSLMMTYLQDEYIPEVNAQIGWLNPTVQIPGLAELTGALTGTDEVDPASPLAAILKFVQAPRVQVNHGVSTMADPLMEILDQHGFDWKRITVDFLFMCTHVYQAGYSISSVVVSMIQFIRTLPLSLPTIGDLINQVKKYLSPTSMADVFSEENVLFDRTNTQGEEEGNNYSQFLSGLLTAGAVVAATLLLGKLPGGKFTNDLFMRMSRMGALITSVVAMKAFLSDSIEAVIDYIRVSVFGYDTRLLNEWQSLDEWCAEVNTLNNTKFEQEVIANTKLQTKVDLLLVKGDDFLKQFDRLKTPPTERSRFNAHYQFLTRIRAIVACGGAGMHVPRVPAVVFHFVGETGVGKSELTSMLNALLLVDQGVTTAEDMAKLIYYRDSSQPRFDGYISQVQGVVIDDYGSRRDSESNPNPEPLELIRMSNGCVWKLEMPNLAEKGNTFFNAKWVILTSNQVNFAYPSLTNPEAVNRRVALKFRQKPHPDFLCLKTINRKQIETLDVMKVRNASRTDEDVYEKVWLFDQLDAADPGEVVLTQDLTFEQMTKMCRDQVDTQQTEGQKKLKHTLRMFNRFVEKAKANTQMEQVREAAPRTKDLSKLKEQVREVTKTKTKVDEGDMCWITAGSKQEMMHKCDIAADYLFGDGGPTGPKKNNTYNKGQLVSNPEVFETAEFLTNDGPLAHSPTIAERVSGMLHLDLGRLVDLNPEFIMEFDPAEYKTYHVESPYDYSSLLTGDCVVVPRDKANLFTKAFCTASSYFIMEGGIGGMERMRRWKVIDWASSVTMFNDIVHFFLRDSLENLKIGPCCHHDRKVPWYRTPYNLVSTIVKAVEKQAEGVKYWYNMLKAEVLFTCARYAGMVLLATLATSAFGILVSWGMRPEPTKEKKRNTESRQEITKGGDAKNVESHQEKTPGMKVKNVESVQEKTQGPSNKNVESHQEKTQGVATKNVESATDVNADEILMKIGKNTYELMTRSAGEEWRRLANVVFISGRVALMNRHVADAIADEVMIRNSQIREGIQCSAAMLNMASFEESSIHEHRDVAVVEFPPNVHLHSSLVEYFMTKSDFSYFTSVKRAALLTTRDKTTTVRYTDSCKAADRTFTLVPSPGEYYIIRDVYHYGVETRKGDCGGLLVAIDKNFERKIIGLHVAGQDGPLCAVACAVHSSLLTALLSRLTIRRPESLLCGQVPNAHCQEAEKPFEGDYVMCGSVPKVFSPRDTKIRPSPLHGILQVPLTKPAYLFRSRNEQGEWVDPLVKARRKALTESVPIDEEILDRCAYSVVQMIRPTTSNDKKNLTRAEAIAGIEGDEFYTSIKRQTSPGYGWKKSGKGKTKWMGTDGFITDDPELMTAVDVMESNIASGKRTGTVWTDTLKDERRPIQKVEEGKTRLFAAGEMAYLVLFRQYFMGFAAHMMKNRINFESCVGINVYSREWTALAYRLQKHGSHVVAGDFSNYDGTLSAAILWKCLDIIEKFYDGTEAERKIRRALWIDIVNSVHVSGTTLYMWTHSQPSGCPITALLNSLYHSVIARYVWILCARKYSPEKVSLTEFDKHVVHNNFGDDDVWNIHPDVVSWFNQETMTWAFAQIGMTYTDELKTGVIVQTRTLDEIQFLKRKFRYDHSQARYRAPLALDTILEMPMWVKGDRNVREITSETLSEAAHELAQHQQGTFDTWFPRFEEAAKIVPTVFSTYREYQEVEFNKYC